MKQEVDLLRDVGSNEGSVNILIKVVIADDQVLLRDMLKEMLNDDNEIEVVGCASDGQEVVDICKKEKPQVVLLDIRMPLVSGIESLIVLKRLNPSIKVIMLTTFEDENSILDSYKNGADGYVLKDLKPQVLVMVVKCIYYDLFVMHKSVHGFMVNQLKSAQNNKAIIPNLEYEDWEFDSTDLSIFRCLAQGNNNKEIAEILNFSEGTVKNKISRILSITGLKDRTQIAVFALKNNLI
jgi:DNA-binding NarL/FixJ family response regulator